MEFTNQYSIQSKRFFFTYARVETSYKAVVESRNSAECSNKEMYVRRREIEAL